jgi:RimJ/RimL family protein N-acetyltransferase
METGWADPDCTEEENRLRRRAWLEWTIQSYDQLVALTQPAYGERAITLRDTGQFIGLVGLVPLLAPFGQLPSFGAMEGSPWEPQVGLFWSILPQHQRRGYATEAAGAVVAWALDAMRLRRIVAGTTHDNAASVAVMRKLGMRIEANPFSEPAWFQVTGLLEPGQT